MQILIIVLKKYSLQTFKSTWSINMDDSTRSEMFADFDFGIYFLYTCILNVKLFFFLFI